MPSDAPMLCGCNKEIGKEVGSDVWELQESVFSEPNGENTVFQERGSDQLWQKLSKWMKLLKGVKPLWIEQ